MFCIGQGPGWFKKYKVVARIGVGVRIEIK